MLRSLAMSNTKRYLEDLNDKSISPQEILNRWFPKGNYTEDDVWDAIAEADGYQQDYYADGDIAEWL